MAPYSSFFQNINLDFSDTQFDLLMQKRIHKVLLICSSYDAFMKLSWSSEEVDTRLHQIMKSIHAACVQYGKCKDGYVDYVKGANVAGFMKVAKAMLEQGVI